MQTTVYGNVRGAYQPIFSEGSDEQFQINIRGEQYVVQGLPPSASIVACGASFAASTTTAAAPVTAIPTTAALIGLWNGEPDNGKSYVIDSVFALVVANTAAVQNHGILANVSVQRVDAALANTITPKPLRANKPYNGMARVAVGITLDATNGVAANWFPVGTSAANSNTPQTGQIIDVPLNGSIILPPSGQLALTVIAGAATATSVQVGMRWHEVVLPIAV